MKNPWILVVIVLAMTGGAFVALTMGIETTKINERLDENTWSADAHCTVDEDCVEVDVDCDPCECYGVGVNQRYEDKYTAWYENTCIESIQDITCHLDCAHEVLKCVENRCQFLPYSSNIF